MSYTQFILNSEIGEMLTFKCFVVTYRVALTKLGKVCQLTYDNAEEFHKMESC